MTSSVFFKFKSQKDPTRVEFDGTGISVFELKRDIIIKSGLGDGKDFDLAIYNEDGNEEYDDDTTIIPRSTTIIARRLPPMKQGAGRAARYVSGKMPINTKYSSRKEQSSTKPGAKPTNALANTSNMTEEQRMAAMFAAQSEQWSAQQEEMALQTRVAVKGGKNTNAPDHEPPTGYVCYRCGEKGHWIQACPTNDNPEFDNKPRVKRTTGIPRSFLKTVEKPVALGADGTMDDTKPPPGIMVNAEGEYVIAEPDKASWAQFQAKTKSSAAAQEAAALGDKELQDRGLECSIDKRIFIDPMKTPCCEKTYCNDCITNALIESDFQCPGCQTDGVLIDDLKPDDETSGKIKAYLAEKSASAKKERSKSPSVKAQTPPVEQQATTKSPSPKSLNPKSPPAVASTVAKAKSPNPEAADAKDPQPPSRKRSADELLENPKIPKGPKAMQQQEAQKQAMLKQQQLVQQQQQSMMNGMPGFPNIPPFNPMMGMNGFGGMPNMSMGMGMNMNMMNGYGMGMGMGMGNPMMGMPILGMNGFGGGAPMNGMSNGGNNMYGGGGAGGAGFGGGMGNNHMLGSGGGGGAQNGGVNGGGGAGTAGGEGTTAAGFSNQQKTIFAEPLPNEEDNAYFRQPVNPHRHQGRQRRARPSDYREL